MSASVAAHVGSAGFAFEPRMKRQSDGINDDWTRRYAELRLGTEFDLVPTATESSPAGG